VEETRAGAVHEEWQSMARTHTEDVHGWLSAVGGSPTLEQGKTVRSPPPEEERVAEIMYDELTANPVPVPLHHWRGADRENWE